MRKVVTLGEIMLRLATPDYRIFGNRISSDIFFVMQNYKFRVL